MDFKYLTSRGRIKNRADDGRIPLKIKAVNQPRNAKRGKVVISGESRGWFERGNDGNLRGSPDWKI